MIIDASVVLRAFFPDEDQSHAQALIRDHISGRVRLAAPDLLWYELTNAVVLAVRRGRITDEDGSAILSTVDGLGIEGAPVTWQQMLPLATEYQRSAYDAAYLALSRARGELLTTADRRLYDAVRDRLAWVQMLGTGQGTC